MNSNGKSVTVHHIKETEFILKTILNSRLKNRSLADYNTVDKLTFLITDRLEIGGLET